AKEKKDLVIVLVSLLILTIILYAFNSIDIQDIRLIKEDSNTGASDETNLEVSLEVIQEPQEIAEEAREEISLEIIQDVVSETIPERIPENNQEIQEEIQPIQQDQQIQEQGSEISDTQAPITSSSYTSQNWQNLDISIALSCFDDVACALTYYCIDNENSCNPWEEALYNGIIDLDSEGINYLRYASNDSSGNIGATNSQILKLDKTSPQLNIISPQNGAVLSGPSYIISGNSSDSISGISKVQISFNDGTWNEVTGTENWQYNWNLVDGTYTIKAKAIDNANNSATSQVSVTVGNPPSARIISLPDPPLVKAGVIQVDVQTSEPVQYRPSLSYSFAGESAINIPLDGSSQSWKGFMIISESDDKKIGTFSFSAVDFGGTTGSVITQGSFFVVDSISPSKANLNIGFDDKGEIKLSWYYNGESIAKFNIYRSKEANLDYADFYKEATSDSSSFVDTDVESGTYYYAIAAVDLAGNIAELSNIVSISTSGTTQGLESTTMAAIEPIQEPKPQLSLETQRRIDSEVEKINSLLGDADRAALDIQSRNYEELNLQQKITQKKAELNSLKTEVESLRTRAASEDSIIRDLLRLDLRVETVRKEIPRDVILIEEKNFEQDISSKDIESAVDEFYSSEFADESDRRKYISYNTRLQREIKVSATVKVFNVTYLEEIKAVTLIKKEIAVTAENVSIYEFIPKDVIEETSDIEFLSEYELVKEDPILKIQDGEFKYIANKRVESVDARRIKTLLLERPSDKSFITGLVTSLTTLKHDKANLGLVLLFITTIVLIAYYLIFIRANASTSFMEESGIEFSERGIGKISGAVNKLLEKAHKDIDAGRFNSARSTYMALLKTYNNIPGSEKKKVYEETVRLYKKLQLYLKIKTAQSFATNAQFDKLNEVVDELAGLYKEVKKFSYTDTRLLEVARYYFRNYY
ncbi:MAG: Ig-like domain-containing protein, partial [Nanoarchaeota archaeon]